VSALVLDGVSRWYGDVVAVNDVTLTVGPGVTGLLGPNGAGKTTLIALMAGLLAPSAGTVSLDGMAPHRDTAVHRRIGLVPEREATYEFLTGRQFVLANARLQRLPDAEAAAERAIGLVEMAPAADRRIATYSKGMRQRIKMATALVHDPEVLLLDEPFNGMDPRQRLQLTALLRELADQGRAVLFSSHILEEVEEIAEVVQVVVAGRHVASGDFREIRRLLTERPHRYTIRCSKPRAVAAGLVADPSVTGVTVEDGAGGVLRVETADVERFTRLLPVLARDHGVRLTEVAPGDESLESVFAYLVARAGTGAGT
jgi:ABC-2 type transport system ATP-binding protein